MNTTKTVKNEYIKPAVKVRSLVDGQPLMAASGPGAGDYGSTPSVGAKPSVKGSLFDEEEPKTGVLEQ